MARKSKEALERQREYSREYQRAHKEEAKAYRKANPEVARKGAARYSRLRRQMLDDFKLARGCQDCGYSAHAEALDFDHVRGEKKFTIGQATSRSFDVLLAEIEKCEVVCANCHRVRTRERRGRLRT